MASNPCAACKVLKVTCTPDCVFAPHFPANEPMRYDLVHKTYGADNVYKFLSNADPSRREDVANSLCYAAEARKNDPVHGAYGMVLHLNHRLMNLDVEIEAAKRELETLAGPDGVPSFVDVPIPDNFPRIPSALAPYTPVVSRANAAQNNQNVQVPTDVQPNVNENMIDGSRRNDVGASTSAGPSKASGKNKKK